MKTNVDQTGNLEEKPESDQRFDVENRVSAGYAAATLRRLADALDQERTFQIQIADERIPVPSHASIQFEHEREGDEVLEIEIKWRKS
jgi:amphi-Trp domain-containing protein